MFAQLLLLIALIVALFAVGSEAFWGGYGYGYPFYGGFGYGGFGLGYGGFGYGLWGR
jgi:hypothetical protein